MRIVKGFLVSFISLDSLDYIGAATECTSLVKNKYIGKYKPKFTIKSSAEHTALETVHNDSS